MKKTVIIFIVSILASTTTIAQDRIRRHEFSAHMGGGISGFQTRTNADQAGRHLQGGIEYRYGFRPKWSFGTGINLAAYNGKRSIGRYDGRQAAVNKLTGHGFDFLTNVSNYKESQRITMIIVPLTAQYQHQIANLNLYTTFGIKIGIPVSNNVKTEGIFTTKGYFPNINVTYENLPDYGFVSNQRFPKDQIDVKLKPTVMTTAEIGVKWSFGKLKGVYTGLFADYGLNATLKSKGQSNLIEYQSNNPSQLVYHPLANHIRLFTVGITCRVVFYAR